MYASTASLSTVVQGLICQRTDTRVDQSFESRCSHPTFAYLHWPNAGGTCIGSKSRQEFSCAWKLHLTIIPSIISGLSRTFLLHQTAESSQLYLGSLKMPPDTSDDGPLLPESHSDDTYTRTRRHLDSRIWWRYLLAVAFSSCALSIAATLGLSSFMIARHSAVSDRSHLPGLDVPPRISVSSPLGDRANKIQWDQ
jgi:hypothetical protein